MLDLGKTPRSYEKTCLFKVLHMEYYIFRGLAKKCMYFQVRPQNSQILFIRGQKTSYVHSEALPENINIHVYRTWGLTEEYQCMYV